MNNSSEALQHMDESGERARMKAVTLRLLRKYPGYTANELEAVAGYPDGALRKRLNDLRHDGLARTGESRPSKVTGRKNATWFLS